MARVLITAWPLEGHLHPCLAIARELQARDHEVSFYSGRRAKATVDGNGFPLHPFDRVDDEAVEQTLFAPERYIRPWRPAKLMSFYERWLGDTLAAQTADLEELVERYRPDLILSEESMWSPALILHETLRVPVVVCSVSAGCLLPGPEAPLVGVGLPPPRGVAMRLFSRFIQGATHAFAWRLRRRVNEVRLSRGLNPIDVPLRTAMARVPLYMVRGAPEFDYERRDLPPSVQYVGALDASGVAAEEIPDLNDRLRAGQPIVFVSEGTMETRPPVLIRAAVEALRGTDVQLVVATGRHRTPDDFGIEHVPPNIHIRQWVPQRWLFARTHVVITVGGCGTILGALAAGVPLLVVPVESDQPDNACRVVQAGAGLSLPRRRCTPQRVRAAVRELIDRPEYRRNALRVAASFARYGGATRAADLVEQCLPRRLKGARHEMATGLDPQEVPA